MLALILSLLVTNARSQVIVDETFQCLELYNCGINTPTCSDSYQPKQFRCCGLVANGSEVCTEAVQSNQNNGVNEDWTKVGDSYHLCTSNVLEAMGLEKNNPNRGQKLQNTPHTQDLCCGQITAFSMDLEGNIDTFQSELPCSPCSSFIVWPYPTFESMNSSIAYPVAHDSDGNIITTDNEDAAYYYSPWTTFNDSWREDFEAQPQHRNSEYPGGFIHAKLREYNKPPVCVYIPNSGGKMIEIKAEPEEPGNRLCVSDLKDDFTNKDVSGQTTTCDDSKLRSCFAEASQDINGNNDVRDFAFYIYCDTEGCEDSDVNFWLRARHNEKRLSEVEDETAMDNPEMYCQYVIDDYPQWDIYPSDITPEIPERRQDFTGSDAWSFTFGALAFLALLY